MSEHTQWQTLKNEGEAMVERLKKLIHEGNIRRVVVQHEGRTVAEFPLTAGVLGAVVAPVVAAVGVLAALLKDCTIQVERADAASKNEGTASPHA